MSDKDLSNFLKKIEQLNQIAELIKNNPNRKLSLSKCKNHDEVIKLTTECCLLYTSDAADES